MKSIKIRAAFCTNCSGYLAATPADKKNINHPDVTDHFFYHGEPWFTLSHKTFKKLSNCEDTVVRILDLEEHQRQDTSYCLCSKKIQTAQPTVKETPKPMVVADPLEYETDLYFSDLYQTYNNFHGINSSGNNQRSAVGSR